MCVKSSNNLNKKRTQPSSNVCKIDVPSNSNVFEIILKNLFLWNSRKNQFEARVV